MKKKYKCLVLDHDDTVVNSTATIHFPCFIEYLGKFYPHLVGNYTLESYFIKNFAGLFALKVVSLNVYKHKVKIHEDKRSRL